MKVIDNILDHLDESSMKRAKADHHSRRRPRPCGLTLHTGIGCPYQCTYCYIYSMGFPVKIEKYPLTPLELTLAVAINKNIVLGPYGTILALGSVTEPFHPVTRKYTLTLIHYLNKYLNNPIQVPTKDVLESDNVFLIRDIKNLSILYSFTTLRHHKLLEPYAPHPKDRFESIRLLRSNGMHVTLFIRPFIPGITDDEIEDFLNIGHSIDVRKVIFGTMRINKRILDNLKHYPKIYDDIKRYLPVKIDNRFRNLKSSQIKAKLIQKAISYGYKVFPSACSASIDASRQACGICSFGPCGDRELLPRIESGLIKEFLEYVGIKSSDIEIDDWVISIKVRESYRKVRKLESYLSTISRRRVLINLI